MAKPPTAAQKRMWGKVFEYGCMACRIDDPDRRTFPQIHHWREYGYRDHSKVFGLCPPHHNNAVPGIPNRHLNPIEFREQYGTDEELFNECMRQIRK